MDTHDSGPDEFDGGRKGGYIVLMDARLTKLEEIADQTPGHLRTLEADVAVIKSNYATKADINALRGEMREQGAALNGRMDALKAEIYREMNKQTWRLVTFVCGFNSALVAATYFVARYVH